MLSGLRKAFGQGANPSPTSTSSPATPTRFFADNAPSWEELAALVAAKRSELGVTAPDLENGPRRLSPSVAPLDNPANLA